MLEQIAQVVGDALSVVLGIVIDKNSVFSAIGLVKDISLIQAMKATEVLAAIKSATPEERAKADAAFKAALVLKDQTWEKRLEAGEMDLERAADLVLRAIQLGKDSVQLINDVKSLVP